MVMQEVPLDSGAYPVTPSQSRHSGWFSADDTVPGGHERQLRSDDGVASTRMCSPALQTVAFIHDVPFEPDEYPNTPSHAMQAPALYVPLTNPCGQLPHCLLENAVGCTVTYSPGGQTVAEKHSCWPGAGWYEMLAVHAVHVLASVVLLMVPRGHKLHCRLMPPVRFSCTATTSPRLQ